MRTVLERWTEGVLTVSIPQRHHCGLTWICMRLRIYAIICTTFPFIASSCSTNVKRGASLSIKNIPPHPTPRKKQQPYTQNMYTHIYIHILYPLSLLFPPPPNPIYLSVPLNFECFFKILYGRFFFSIIEYLHNFVTYYDTANWFSTLKRGSSAPGWGGGYFSSDNKYKSNTNV